MKSKYKRIIVALLVLIECLALTGCTACNMERRPAYTDETKLDIRGEVKEIEKGENSITVLVEGEIKEDTLYNKASVLIRKGIVIREGLINDNHTISDIKVGNIIEVNFEGGGVKPYPVYGKAISINIIGKTEK